MRRLARVARLRAVEAAAATAEAARARRVDDDAATLGRRLAELVARTGISAGPTTAADLAAEAASGARLRALAQAAAARRMLTGRQLLDAERATILARARQDAVARLARGRAIATDRDAERRSAEQAQVARRLQIETGSKGETR